MPFCDEYTAAQTTSQVPHNSQPEDGSRAEAGSFPRRCSTATTTATTMATAHSGSSQLI
ncbi:MULTISPECIES: hypothetical protein [Streptomyces]|uniref:hypothetical protein n=1 Tax=Streptomyces TaxID=1883 RepID=UPI001CEC3844|nr:MULTISPECIES: hypothetical protein [Streptomyces]MDI5904971.1 hypothetical protein [Streptomyces sp. 12257]